MRADIGDRGPSDWLRSDEEIAAQLARTPDERIATAVLAEGLAAEYARRPDSIGGPDGTISWRERVKTWIALAAAKRAEVTADAATASGYASASRHATRFDGDEDSEYVRSATWWEREGRSW